MGNNSSPPKRRGSARTEGSPTPSERGPDGQMSEATSQGQSVKRRHSLEVSPSTDAPEPDMQGDSARSIPTSAIGPILCSLPSLTASGDSARHSPVDNDGDNKQPFESEHRTCWQKLCACFSSCSGP